MNFHFPSQHSLRQTVTERSDQYPGREIDNHARKCQSRPIIVLFDPKD